MIFPKKQTDDIEQLKNMVIDLARCPHCGGEVQLSFDLELVPDGVICRKCKMIVHYYGLKYKDDDTYVEMINRISEKWNKREQIQESTTHE